MTAKNKSTGAPRARPRHKGQSAHRIVFVTGKGGVGKSMIAAATVFQFACAGRSVLRVELGSRSAFAPRRLAIDDEPVCWTSQIRVACWDDECALRKYIAHYLVFKAAADRILGSTVMTALVAAALGLAEMAMLGKLTAPIRHGWYALDAVPGGSP